jgi:hypothetical protein
MNNFHEETSRLEAESNEWQMREKLREIENMLKFIDRNLAGLGNRVNMNFDNMMETFANHKARMDTLQDQINSVNRRIN